MPIVRGFWWALPTLQDLEFFKNQILFLCWHYISSIRFFQLKHQGFRQHKSSSVEKIVNLA